MTALNHTRTFALLAAMTALFAGIGFLVGGAGGMAIAFVIAIALNVFSFWNADKIVLRAYRATPAQDRADDPRVRAYLEDVRLLAARAGMPEPTIAIIDTPQPNAFATGRDPHHAAVVATTGLLELLPRDEIAGVMAHELAHVKNRDTLTMTVTATLAGAIGMLANFAMFFGGGRERGGLIASLAIMILAPMAAALVQMAISRAREYEADRVGAEIMGDPRPLARALARIESAARQRPNARAEANPATAHVFIINPLNGQRGDQLFSTHPATRNRIDRLNGLAASMGVQPGSPDAPAPAALRPGPAIAPGVHPGAPHNPWGRSTDPRQSSGVPETD